MGDHTLVCVVFAEILQGALLILFEHGVERVILSCICLMLLNAVHHCGAALVVLLLNLDQEVLENTYFLPVLNNFFRLFFGDVWEV